jgi:methionine synthase / methylenetetrahydrofolate reductase(NADPH)
MPDPKVPRKKFSMGDFHSRLLTGPLLADGAMGTLLHARGAAPDECFEALNLARPEMIRKVHEDYIAAGADMITTNTFGANRFKLAARGLEERQDEIISAGAALARDAAASAPRRILVAGSIGPLGVRVAPYGRLQPEQAEAAFGKQADLLLRGGVDLLLLETFADVRELLAALRAAKSAGGAPVLASLTFTRDDLTILGDPPAEAASALQAAGADAVGINCSSGPAQAMRILRIMRQTAPEAIILVKPNAGWPENVGGRILYPAAPQYFGRYAQDFARAGARIVGGCCGTTPEHIAAMRRTLDSAQPAQTDFAAPAMPRAEEIVLDPAVPSSLAEKLAAGKFVVGVEVDPPKGFSLHKLTAGASLLAEAGADVINVADSPMARMRMSPWAVCHLLQERFGVETVLHFPTRGRNLLRVQGDLLAAHALGIRNLFVVMGDPAAVGDFPEAHDQCDIVPSGLIRLIKKSFNAGLDHAGKQIGQPTSFFVGCALNLNASDLGKEAKTLRKKLEAGADFILTQPVFESAPAERFLDAYRAEYGPLTAPVLAGILPLYGGRHASFLHNEVPGIFIPESVRARIERAGEQAPQEGVRLAAELLRALRGIVQGVYLMPPFGHYEIGAEILDAIRAG